MVMGCGHLEYAFISMLSTLYIKHPMDQAKVPKGLVQRKKNEGLTKS